MFQARVLSYPLPEAVRQPRSPQTAASPSLSSGPRSSPAALSGAEPQTGRRRSRLFRSAAVFPAGKPQGSARQSQRGRAVLRLFMASSPGPENAAVFHKEPR